MLIARSVPKSFEIKIFLRFFSNTFLLYAKTVPN